MRPGFTAVLLASAAALLTVPAIAQTRFCIGGDLDQLSATDRATCSATMQAVRNAATTMHAPQGWHFVVVCGESGWKSYTAFSSRGEVALETAAADTDRSGQTTYFREDRLQTTEAHGLRRVVAHEIASILLNTDDEDAIQLKMASLETTDGVQQASLQK